jgi:membrane dipeptidase
MHCDSLLKGIDDHQLYDRPGNMLDVSRMILAGQGAQFFAVFFPPKPSDDVRPPAGVRPMPLSDDALFERARSLLLDTAAAYSSVLRMVYNAGDIRENMRAGLISALLTVEDGRAVNGDMARLGWFFNAGVRVMGLTWNAPNCFGHPNSPDPGAMALGLTEFGREAIHEMNTLGILIDVSHLSDGGFTDVAALSKKPFAATHSNCRALCGHPRNLTDGMIRMLASAGGVAGVNFMPGFLTSDGGRESRVEDICRHVLHFINTGGEDCVALGTDFDGIDGAFEIGQPTEMSKLFDALEQRGLSERQLEKFAFSNVLRVLSDAL